MFSSAVQCAAVKTHLLLTREPPHHTLLLPDERQIKSEDAIRWKLTLADQSGLPGILIDLSVDPTNNLGDSVGQAASAVRSTAA